MDKFLFDKTFLRQLDEYRNKETYAKIIALTFDEKPIETIEGKITDGSINIDGDSAIRRSCSLTMVAEDVDINNFYWGLNHKFKLFIGVKNDIDSSYPDICWFKQGTYIITTFSTSLSTNSFTISIEGKDKMCLLNGDVGGTLPASTDFGTIQTDSHEYTKITFEDKIYYSANKYYTYDAKKDEYTISLTEYDSSKTYYERNEYSTIEDLKIKNIIREAVHTWAKEPYYNIIVNDLESSGLELMEYRGDTDIFVLYDVQQGAYTNMTAEKNTVCYIPSLGKSYTLATMPEEYYNNLVDDFNETAREVVFPQDGVDTSTLTHYLISKLSYGDSAGYQETDLTYSGDLISAVGDSLTSMLDKIVSMLGNFEYFYDLDGRFIFQQKKTYVNTSWNSIVDSTDDDPYVENAAQTSASIYSFDNNILLTAVSNTPNLANLRNDYSVWGERELSSDKKVPIHYRYAIDKKPTQYTNLSGTTYYVETYDEVYERLYNRYYEEIIQPKIDEFNAYKKTKNPNGLPEDWWEVSDWAEYYKTLMGVLPSGTLGNYVTVKAPDTFNPLNYFDEPTVGKTYYYNGSERVYNGGDSITYSWGSYYPNSPIIDINSDGSLGYTGHGVTCSHSYSYFLNHLKHGVVSYFYKPKIPQAEIEEELYSVVKKQVAADIGTDCVFGCDWREVIYQMSVDYYQYYDVMDGDSDEDKQQADSFLFDVMMVNGLNDDGDYLYPDGKTGYEIYYSDLFSFWRDLYNPEAKVSRKTLNGNYQSVLVEDNADKGTHYYETQWVAFSYDYTDLECDYYLPESEYETQLKLLKTNVLDYDETKVDFIVNKEDYFSDTYAYWNKNIVQSPESLNFWFDFLDNGGELEQFGVSVVGDRPKAINDSDVSVIYYRNTPNIIYYTHESTSTPEEQQSGYVYVPIPTYMEDLFHMSSNGKSAKDELDSLIYQYAYCIESISITSLPIYYLEPNRRITVHDENSNINGEYIMTKISLPLSYNGTMSITATKAANRLY